MIMHRARARESDRPWVRPGGRRYHAEGSHPLLVDGVEPGPWLRDDHPELPPLLDQVADLPGIQPRHAVVCEEAGTDPGPAPARAVDARRAEPPPPAQLREERRQGLPQRARFEDVYVAVDPEPGADAVAAPRPPPHHRTCTHPQPPFTTIRQAP